MVTDLHTDLRNDPYDICWILAFGDFDYTKSAHLIVEIGLTRYIIEFPPGVAIGIPSALLVHGNSKIVGPGETRGSIARWFPGPLKRWYRLGGRPVAALSAAEKAQYKSCIPTMVEEALKRYPLL